MIQTGGALRRAAIRSTRLPAHVVRSCLLVAEICLIVWGYTQIGLITLIGLISKHGILMVAFANEIQVRDNLDRAAAIIRAAQIRLRPVLMTTAAMTFGVLPLLFASGAGANSRFGLGVVIVCGMLVGTLFTLFVLPTIYAWLARELA